MVSSHIFIFVAVDKQFIAPKLNLVYCEDLNKILQFEIFLYKDGQLRVAHVILGCKPISSSFQSPKHVIKVKDPRLPMINVAVLGFIAGPPLEGTQHIDLTNQQTANEEVILPDSKKEEFVRELEVVDLEEDFDVFS